MNITFYNNKSENIRVSKFSYLTEIKTISGSLKNGSSIINPTIEIQTTTPLTEVNYAYIEEFKRYYFINNIVLINENFWNFEMIVDVLMSFKDKFLPLNAYITRYQNSTETNYIDNVYPVKSIPTIDIIKSIHETYSNISEKFDSYNIVLILAGGDASFNYEMNYTGYNYFKLNGSLYFFGNSIKNIGPINKNCRVYIISNFDADLVLSTISKDSALLSQVLDCFITSNIIPITESAHNSYGVLGGKPVKELEIGNTIIPLTLDAYLCPDNFNDIYTTVYEIGNIEVNDFMDYEPYSSYDLYIPLYGWVNIPAKYLKNNYIILRSVFDITIGEYSFTIYALPPSKHSSVSDGKPIIIETFSVNVSSKLPLNSDGSVDTIRQTSYNQIVKNMEYVRNSTSFGSDVISNIGNLVTKPKNIGAIFDIVGGAVEYSGNMIASAMSYDAKEILNVPIGKGQVRNSTLNAYNISSNQIVLFKTHIEKAISKNDFAKLCGLPYNKYVTLNSLSGFAIIDNIHLDNISATKTEKEMILATLSSGVIF